MRVAFPASVALALAAGTVLPTPGHGQLVPSPYSFIEERQEVGIFAGYLDAGTGRFGYGPAGGPWIGGRYGIELSGPLSIEAVAGAVTGTRDVISPARPEGDRVIAETDALLATIEGRLKLSVMGPRSWHGLSPFVVFGGGIIMDAGGDSPTDVLLEADEVFDFGTSFMGSAGIGTRWFVTRRFAARVDALFSLWNIETPPGFSDPVYEFVDVPRDEWVSGLSLTASILFRW